MTAPWAVFGSISGTAPGVEVTYVMFEMGSKMTESGESPANVRGECVGPRMGEGAWTVGSLGGYTFRGLPQ